MSYIHCSLFKKEFVIYTGEPPVPVSADDPRVKQAMKDAEDKARASNLNISVEMQTKALRNGIQTAEQKRREAHPAGPLYVYIVRPGNL